MRQTKRDARLSVAGAPPINTRQVTDGVDFDALARPIVQYGPTADPGPATEFSPDAVNGAQTVTSWFSYDLYESVTQPGGRTTTYNYPWETLEGVDGTSPLLAWTETTDPEGRVTDRRPGRPRRRRASTSTSRRRATTRTATRSPPTADLQTEYVVNSLGELRGGRRLDRRGRPPTTTTSPAG